MSTFSVVMPAVAQLLLELGELIVVDGGVLAAQLGDVDRAGVVRRGDTPYVLLTDLLHVARSQQRLHSLAGGAALQLVLHHLAGGARQLGQVVVGVADPVLAARLPGERLAHVGDVPVLEVAGLHRAVAGRPASVHHPWCRRCT